MSPASHKPIVVTGAAGFIGSNLALELHRRATHPLILVDRDDAPGRHRIVAACGKAEEKAEDLTASFAMIRLTDQPVRMRLFSTAGFTADSHSQNVIGEVRGSGAPDEVIVIGGHLDSWDLGTGAIDDGAGCAIAIEAARLIAESPRRPRRTIRVVLYANEESGLAGGRGYAARHAAELPKHAGAFEADSGTGAPLGFAGPVGLADKSVKVIADYSVETIKNGVSGANKKDYHLANITLCRDFQPSLLADVRKITKGERCSHCGKELQFSRGIEIGHTFKLGMKYSKAMNATYLDASGKESFMVMGCYGIGVSRIVAATIEQSNDANGIIWPVALAPFQVSIVPVNIAEENTKRTSEELYERLTAAGVEVLLDDREERAGIKFKDADLIGIPYRITVSERSLKEGNVEYKARWEAKEQARLIPVGDIVAHITALLTQK